MRTLHAFGVLLMMFGGVAPARGGLYLAWNACPGITGAESVVDFSCDPTVPATYSLYATFSLPNQAAGVVAMDNILDIRIPNAVSAAPFWQFQGGGCNESGIQVLTGKPTTGCGTALQNSPTMCGSVGQSCWPYVIYVYGGSFQDNRARIYLRLGRLDTQPITLPATFPGISHFGFELRFSMDHAPGATGGGCEGCASEAAITWNQAIFYNIPSVSAVLSSTDPGSTPTAFVNCHANCEAVRVRRSSWGALKAMFR